MHPRVLLDTHILLRWRAAPQKLSRDQVRVLGEMGRRHETAAISAMTLLELATLFSRGALLHHVTLDELFADLEDDSVFRILPLSVEVAKESSLLRNVLRDPADCVIVATARVHGLRLLTSDQRISGSNLVSTVA